MGTVDDTVGGTRALEGSSLGAYRIERLLGEGAMGEVFLATHVALGRPVALKTLKPAIAADRALTERFFAEARAVNIIRHENIVECTDLVNDPTGRSYIVMELLEGRTLGAAIHDAGRIPARRAARIIAQIADAIAAAHDKGIVHRDLKPENIYLIKRAGSNDYVKVLDFGIARLRPELGVSATQSGALIGTPAYMSPEQVRGEKVGPAADIYAVGVILFHMLTGRMPFEAASLSMMLVAQLQETPARVDELVADVPTSMADVVARALAKDVTRRPRDMASLKREVLEAVGLPNDVQGSMVSSDASSRARPISALAPTLPPTGQSSISAAAAEVVATKPARNRWIYAVVGGVVVAGLIVAIAVFGPWSEATRSDRPQITAQPPPPIATPTPSPPAAQKPSEQQLFDTERAPAKIVDALAIAPGSRVADVGAGSGLLTVHLARAVAPGGTIVATDIDDAVLGQLARRIDAAGLSSVVERRVVSADAPGLEKASYDAILVSEVDHYVADATSWLAAAKLALKPNGRLVITNRLQHKTKALAAAAKAGLELKSESSASPTHYVAVFAARKPAAAAAAKRIDRHPDPIVAEPRPRVEAPVSVDPPKGDRTKTLVDPNLVKEGKRMDLSKPGERMPDPDAR